MTEGNEPMKNNRFVAAVLIPGFVFMLIFAVFPVAYGLGISFYDYNPASTHNLFLGIDNYKSWHPEILHCREYLPESSD